MGVQKGVADSQGKIALTVLGRSERRQIIESQHGGQFELGNPLLDTRDVIPKLWPTSDQWFKVLNPALPGYFEVRDSDDLVQTTFLLDSPRGLVSETIQHMFGAATRPVRLICVCDRQPCQPKVLGRSPPGCRSRLRIVVRHTFQRWTAFIIDALPVSESDPGEASKGGEVVVQAPQDHCDGDLAIDTVD